MYVGKEAFVPATTREAARRLFARSVNRVEVETHSYCNRRCAYCPNAVGDRLAENRRMPDDVWALLLSDLAEIDFAGSVVLASYNEPLADRMILQRIREVRAHVPRAGVGVFTNGDYLDADYLAELADAGLGYMHVSIHPPAGRGYSDADATAHIAALARRIGTAVEVRDHEAGEYVVGVVPHPTIAIDVRAVDYLRHGVDRGGLVDGLAPHPPRTLPCHYPFSIVHVGYQGTIVPCCNVRSDSAAHEPYHYGNLRDFGSLFEAYAGRVATEWRRHLASFEPKQAPCASCTVGFLTRDPEQLARVRGAWERHVRDGAGTA